MELQDAEKRIAQILAAVETEEGAHVDHVDIEDIEYQTFDADRPTLNRHVRIRFKRLPGQQWGQLE